MTIRGAVAIFVVPSQRVTLPRTGIAFDNGEEADRLRMGNRSRGQVICTETTLMALVTADVAARKFGSPE